MKFLELIDRAKQRGVEVLEMRGGNPDIAGAAEDSRKVTAGDLFVARAGTKADGTKFIAEAISRGAVAIVAGADAETHSSALSTQHSVALVGDTNLAAAILAHEIAGNPTAKMTMIGITGTKGKTTVAYLLRSVLKAAGHRVGMIGTVEIDDGKNTVPAEMTTPGAVELVEMFSRMRDNGVSHCVMEVSSHALHQKRVAGIDFAVAVFTNLTGDHLDYHKTMEEYAAAKAILFDGLTSGATAVVNADDRWAVKMVEKCTADIVRCRVVDRLAPALGPASSGGQWDAAIMSMTSARMIVQIRGPWWSANRKVAENGMLAIDTGLIGRHNAYNILCVTAAASACGVDFLDVVEAIEKSDGVPGRLQRVEGRGATFDVFVDYAHTHNALENVLKALRATMGDWRIGPTIPMGRDPSRDRKGATGLAAIAQGSLPDGRGSDGRESRLAPRLICVFGCGGDRDRTKRPKMGAIAERLADQVIVTSDNPRTENAAGIIEEICAGFSPGWKNAGKITIEPDRRAAIKTAIGTAECGDVVLIAGKGHENYQIIGATKHHFDDVEEAQAALAERFGPGK